MDPEGRIRTGTSRMDSPSLYQLSYLGVVSEMLRKLAGERKMAESHLSA